MSVEKTNDFFNYYFFPRNTGYSAVRLAYLLWEQGVPGSNPGTPTNFI